MEEFSLSMVVVTLWETFGWLSVVGGIIALLLLMVLLKSLVRRRRRQLPVGRLLWHGMVVMLIAAAVITPFVPVWTMAPVGDLRGVVDVVIAYAIALAPASIFGVLWIYLGSLRGQPAA